MCAELVRVERFLRCNLLRPDERVAHNGPSPAHQASVEQVCSLEGDYNGFSADPARSFATPPPPPNPPTSPPKRAVQGHVLRPFFASCFSYITCKAEECCLSSGNLGRLTVMGGEELQSKGTSLVKTPPKRNIGHSCEDPHPSHPEEDREGGAGGG